MISIMRKAIDFKNSLNFIVASFDLMKGRAYTSQPAREGSFPNY
jgi:hypothetical protein